MRHLDKFVANARVAGNNGGHCWFPKVKFLVIKSLYVMKSNSELWGFKSKNNLHISSVCMYESEQGFTH